MPGERVFVTIDSQRGVVRGFEPSSDLTRAVHYLGDLLATCIIWCITEPGGQWDTAEWCKWMGEGDWSGRLSGQRFHSITCSAVASPPLPICPQMYLLFPVSRTVQIDTLNTGLLTQWRSQDSVLDNDVSYRVDLPRFVFSLGHLLAVQPPVTGITSSNQASALGKQFYKRVIPWCFHDIVASWSLQGRSRGIHW